MKSCICRDITPSSPLKVACFYSGFLLGLFFNPEDGGDVFPKHRLTFSGLHVISQQIVLFIPKVVTETESFVKYKS
jgi:hypothetical protein